MRIKAVIAYDGSKFYGFQKQNSTNQTVTTQIELALKSLHIDTSIVGSGRTDRGVHASSQIIHFDLPTYWEDLNKLQNILNQKLKFIRFKHIIKTKDTFHARFDAKRRLYRYIFKTSPISVFQHNYISYYPKFDFDKLQEALSCFMGVHDFKFFHKQGSNVHTTVREIYKSFFIQKGDYCIIYFEANGFLRSQVRMMVNAAMQVAQNTLSVKQLQEQIATQHQYTTKLAPPEGLYLAKIIY